MLLEDELLFCPETPPRTWGRLIKHSLRDKLQGNTPTHVGKTLMTVVSVSLNQKHPHARGEDLVRDDTEDGRRETPPRTWGRR